MLCECEFLILHTPLKVLGTGVGFLSTWCLDATLMNSAMLPSPVAFERTIPRIFCAGVNASDLIILGAAEGLGAQAVNSAGSHVLCNH